MAANKDYYKVLGIDRNADDKAIKRAYRKLAKKYHPDANPGDKHAEEMFKEITEAYNILSDPKKKKMYDQFGSAAFEEGFGQQGGAGPDGGTWHFNNGNGYQEFHFNGSDMNMDDLFGDMFGSFFHGNAGGGQQRTYRNAGGFGGFGANTGGFGGGAGGQYQQQTGPMEGSSITRDITISFRDAAFGCERQMRLAGSDGQAHTMKVHIPAGIDEGQSVRLRGHGNPGIAGGAPGDLLLKVHISPERGFSRKGQDVYQDVEIPFTTAVFGGSAVVNTIQGRVRVKIPAGMRSGSKLKLRGKGIPSMKNPGSYGDTYAVIRIEVPQNLSAKAKEKLREFEAAVNE